MSEFSILISPQDKLILKELAKHTKSLLKVEVKQTAILNSLATALGYPSWQILDSFNTKHIFGSDIFKLIKDKYPEVILSTINKYTSHSINLEEALEYAKSSIMRFSPFSNEWLDNWDGDESDCNYPKLCLVPLEKTNCYEVIIFRHELELLMKIESNQSFGICSGPVVEIAPEHIFRRHRPYESSVPLLKYIEEKCNDVIFIEDNEHLVINHKCLASVNLPLLEKDIEHLLYKLSFKYPFSFECRPKIEGNAYCLYFEHSYASIKVATKELNDEQLISAKEKLLPSGEAISLELWFMYRAIIEVIPIDTSNTYEHFCKIQIAKLEGFTFFNHE
ncbi:hypothetical protein AB4140_18845 [Shewanella sp. 10N.286.51.B2]|uniref:hypothetical protein n=1 Tax=Shewanella sp. 10N.286.51.B2 TaxID=3229707 RepID=UPI00354C4B56